MKWRPNCRSDNTSLFHSRFLVLLNMNIWERQKEQCQSQWHKSQFKSSSEKTNTWHYFKIGHRSLAVFDRLSRAVSRKQHGWKQDLSRNVESLGELASSIVVARAGLERVHGLQVRHVTEHRLGRFLLTRGRKRCIAAVRGPGVERRPSGAHTCVSVPTVVKARTRCRTVISC